MRTRLLASGLAIGCVLVIVGVAFSATVESKRVTVASNTIGSAAATCPRGNEVVANGFRSIDFDPDWLAEAIYPFQARRTGARKASTSGANLGADSGKLEAVAYCARNSAGVTVARSEPAAVGPHAVESATARCPRGSEAVGGGSASPGFALDGPRVYAVASRRWGERSWRVTGAEIHDQDGGSIVAFAYCDRSEPGLRARSKRVEIPATYGALGTPSVRCKRGERVRSGGFEAVAFDPAYIAGPTVYTLGSYRTGPRTWTAIGHYDGDDPQPAGDFVAYAYCLD